MAQSPVPQSTYQRTQLTADEQTRAELNFVPTSPGPSRPTAASG